MNPQTSPHLSLLRNFAAVTALLAVAQTVLGLLVAFTDFDGVNAHGWIGYATFIAAVAAAIGAFLWKKVSGNTGLFMHAAGVAVLALIQIGLAEMGQRWAHIILGLLILGAALALASLAFRKPGVVLDTHTR